MKILSIIVIIFAIYFKLILISVTPSLKLCVLSKSNNHFLTKLVYRIFILFGLYWGLSYYMEKWNKLLFSNLLRSPVVKINA